MPVSGNGSDMLAKIQKLTKELSEQMGPTQEKIARNIVTEVRAVLVEQFTTGAGPYGPWQETKRGKPALISKKLPQDFWGQPYPGGAQFGSRVPWLRAHHEGRTFASQKVAANTRYLTFNKRGKLISHSRALRGDGAVRGGVYQRYAAAHGIRARVLPERPIYPDQARGMPPRWANAISAGARSAIRQLFR